MVAHCRDLWVPFYVMVVRKIGSSKLPKYSRILKIIYIFSLTYSQIWLISLVDHLWCGYITKFSQNKPRLLSSLWGYLYRLQEKDFGQNILWINLCYYWVGTYWELGELIENIITQSVTMSSTDFPFQHLIFWNLFEFSAAEIT